MRIIYTNIWMSLGKRTVIVCDFDFTFLIVVLFLFHAFLPDEFQLINFYMNLRIKNRSKVRYV